ncbi:hypothetical protein AABB24_016727 [Solanum stoloniferum]|uniref:RRM domain-containing protein n=1 Tax=Solanum stoloniferum TaxID=62892 RepID=A0ABD2THT3_9SOLN
MEENEGGGLGDGHRNEAIPAVADDGFLVEIEEEEEDDDDCGDLYNNINVGENFLQSVRKNEEEEKAVELRQETGNAAVTAAIVASRISSGVDGSRDMAVRGNEMRDRDLAPAARLETSVAGGIKIECSDPSGKMDDLAKNASSNIVNREIIQRPTAASANVLGNARNVGNSGNGNMVRRGMVSGNAMGSMGSSSALGGGDGSGGTILFVGNLHWWTTDAQVELELSRYGTVEDVKFFDEIASGKSNGYCWAEFSKPAAAMACREGMDGHYFNGRACVVRFASPSSLKSLEEGRTNRINLYYSLSQTASVNRINRYNATVGNFQDGGNLGRAGPQMMGVRGPLGPKRNRVDGVVGRELMGNAGGGLEQGIGAASTSNHPQTMMGQGFHPGFGGPMGNAGGGLRQGIGAASSSNHPQTMMGQGFHPGFGGPMGNAGGGLRQGIGVASSSNHPQTMMGQGFHPGFGGPMGNAGGGLRQGIGAASSLIHPQTMMGQGFYSAFRGPMGRIGGYGGFSGGLTLPFSGRLTPFPPAHFRRGMPMNSIGMMPRAGMEGPNMGRWTGDEHGYRAGESSNVAESDYQYGEESRDRGTWPSNRENDRPDSSDRRYIDNREPSGRDDDWQERRRQDDRDVESSRGRDHDPARHQDREHKRGHHRDDNADRHRHRDREKEHDDEQDRGRSSSTQAKSQSKSKGKAPMI